MLITKVEKTIPIGTKVRIKSGGHGWLFASGLGGTVVEKPEHINPEFGGMVETVVFISVENVSHQHYCHGKIIGLPQTCALIIIEDGKTEETPNAQKG